MVLDGGDLFVSPVDGGGGEGGTEGCKEGWYFGGEGGEVGLCEFLLGEVSEECDAHLLLSLIGIELVDAVDIHVEDVESVGILFRSILLIEFEFELRELDLHVFRYS